MILRRLTQHMNDQNWFAVALDFFIVVVGVFIGVQVGNWNSGRLDKRVYDEAHARVIGEMKQNLISHRWVQDGIREELPIIQSALDDLRACRTNDAAMVNIKAALPVLNAPYALAIDTSALEQFVKNNSFLQYQSPEDRRMFSRMFLYFDYVQSEYNDSLDRLEDAIKKMDSVVKPGPLTVSGPEEILAVILSDDPLSPPLHRDPVLSVPLAQACQNKDFLAGFYAWETLAFHASVLAGEIEAGLRRNLVEMGETVPDTDISATE